MRSKTLILSLRDNDHLKRLKDPYNDNLYHAEALLPFTEAVKLDVGNANVRPPSEKKKPVDEMFDTINQSPATFHLKTRGRGE